MTHDDIEAEIKKEYRTRKNQNGWTFLYSAKKTLIESDEVLIGLHPGGKEPASAETFSFEEKSHYYGEWEGGYEAGEHPFQKQAKFLIETLRGKNVNNVLCGNLIPFRASSWNTLENKPCALEFGKKIWEPLLTQRPFKIFVMGRVCEDVIVSLLHAKKTDEIPTNWGEISARFYIYDKGVICALPCLSRYKIFLRGKTDVLEEKIRKF